jgi:hypothetical protein
MRKISFFVSVLLLYISASAVSFGKGVDETVAKSTGLNHLISQGIPGVQSVSDLVTAYVATATVNGETVTDYYVFNINGGTGFVMVSGDDRVQPILAYSSEASFDIDKISPDAKWLIEGFRNQITWVITHNEVAPEQKSAASMWKELQQPTPKAAARTTVVAPLLTTTWDQSPHYNYLCPAGTPTGCVATAMAQIMKYHNWPTVGTGYHSYSTSTVGGTLSADFGNTVYKWASMPNSISTNNVYIGTLMLHAGVAVSMDYTTTSSGSGAYTSETYATMAGTRYCAEYALKTFFHYKQSLHSVELVGASGTIPTATWIGILKAEMDASRPVLYSGSGTSGGHAWVCDGYDATNKMHFNWGWGGVGPNGYYSVTSIVPPALGTGGGSGGGFNNNQSIIIGISPDVVPSASGNIKMLSHVDCATNVPINYMSGFSVVAKILNSNTTTFNGDFCAQAFDTNSVCVGTLQILTGKTINAGDSTSSLTFTTTGLPGMIPGTHGLRIMYRATGTSAWTPVGDNGTFINFNALDVVNSQSIELYDSLHVGSHTILRGQPLTINTKLANYGTAGFSGTLRAALIDINSGTSYPVQVKTGQSISSGAIQSQTFTNSAITAPGGTYVLAIQHQPGAAGSYITTGSDYYINPIMFTIVTATEVKNVANEANNVVIYPNPANDVFNIALNGANVDNIRIMDIQGKVINTIATDKNQPIIKVPVNDYAAGVYFVQLQSGSSVMVKKIVIAK